MSLDALIAKIRNEHPGLAAPVAKDGTVSWLLPTSWVFLARDDGDALSMAVSKGDRPAAWIPTTEAEALGCFRWFLKRRA